MLGKVKEIIEPDLQLINKLTSIEEEAFGRGGLNEWGLAPLIYHGAVYIIKTDNKPVGVAEYMRDMERIQTAYLYGLAIDKEYRGQGLGKQLLEESLSKLKQKGIKEVKLTVAPANERAQALYRQFDFAQKDYRVDEYGAGEDRIIMRRNL